MAYMKELYQELQSIGIEPDQVNIEAVSDFMQMYQEKTGKEIGIVDAVKEMYITIQ